MGTSCYRLSTSSGTWSEANSRCQQFLQGHLVDITSLGEQQFVEKLLSDSDVQDAWFGLRRLLTLSDDSYLEPATWQNIVADDDSTCFQIHFNRGYFEDRKWLDVPCDEDYGFICETEGRWVLIRCIMASTDFNIVKILY